MEEMQIGDDTHTDYRDAKRRSEEAMRRGIRTDRFSPRFVPLASREMRSDIPKEAIKAINSGKNCMSYRGIPMVKDPFDMVLYELLFYEVQPRTVIELGAYTGASALWMADTLEGIGVKAHVHAVEYDGSLVHSMARDRKDLTVHEGDCNKIEEVFSAETLAAMEHPLVLIDDAHVNIPGVYGHFHRHAMRPGDYMIIEDTNPAIPGSVGHDDGSEWGDWKWKEVETFFGAHPSRYAVDRYYTDFFGYNGTWNWNGYIKRVAGADGR